MIEKKLTFLKHLYGTCDSNIVINELIHAGLPYYPVFSFQFAFRFVPRQDGILDDTIEPKLDEMPDDFAKTGAYQVYGIRPLSIERDGDKGAFFDKIEKNLETSSYMPCMLDGYYDEATTYAGKYRKVHGFHGRIITGLDENYVYYQATHPSDPGGEFQLSREEFWTACGATIDFEYPAISKSREEIHSVINQALQNWFCTVNYEKMFEDMMLFSEAIRMCPDLSIYIEPKLVPNRLPKSRLFRNLNGMCLSRGAAVSFFQGYLDDFKISAYQVPLEHLRQSLNLWTRVKMLLVKYGMKETTRFQTSMADYLLQICEHEQEAVALLKQAISEEMNH